MTKLWDVPTLENPVNLGLEKALNDFRGAFTREAAMSLYAELTNASLAIAQVAPKLVLGKVIALSDFLTVQGADGKVRLSAFTSHAFLRACYPNAQGYLTLPARVVAEIVLKEPTAAGLLLNPGHGLVGGQPVDRHGLQAVARTPESNHR